MSLIPRSARYPWDEWSIRSGDPNQLATYLRRLITILRKNYNDIYLAFVKVSRLIGEGKTESKTWDPANIASGASTTTTITVSGAVLGDFVIASFSLDQAGCVLSAYVSAADTVTVVLFNATAGAVNLASGTLYARVLKRDPS